MPASPNAPASKISGSALQDDQALYVYLKNARLPIPGALFYQQARQQILAYEAGQGRFGQSVIESLAGAFATFIDDLQWEVTPPPTKVGLWPTFLAYYKIATKRAFTPDGHSLHQQYFARDVLLLAMQNDKDAAFAAIAEAFKGPSQTVIKRYYPNEVVDFDDVYQEAILNLFSKPPQPGGGHTAQLFSYFRTILTRRAADVLRKQEANLQATLAQEKNIPKSNNLNTFTDHIIEAYQLAPRFASDNIREILLLALGQVGTDCQALLKLRYFESLKFREIAQKLEISTDSVGTRVKRCLTKLRKLLKN